MSLWFQLGVLAGTSSLTYPPSGQMQIKRQHRACANHITSVAQPITARSQSPAPERARKLSLVVGGRKSLRSIRQETLASNIVVGLNVHMYVENYHVLKNKLLTRVNKGMCIYSTLCDFKLIIMCIYVFSIEGLYL